MATAANAGTSSGAYSAKPGSYGSSYGGGTSYDSLASTGQAAEYKGAGSGYTGSQTGKSGSSTGNTNSSGSTAAEISAGMYATKSHVALSKVNVSSLIKNLQNYFIDNRNSKIQNCFADGTNCFLLVK